MVSTLLKKIVDTFGLAADGFAEGNTPAVNDTMTREMLERLFQGTPSIPVDAARR